ncbi:hypothetical protein JW752_02075 [Candidatus Peregrinibacteria bacterium]|nr:hypothetical protein [Candidatus Peregrinibacteria bacterium]
MVIDPKTTTLTVPDETREKFPELVDMIIGSQSMNDEERQYWVDVLPIMTEEQLDNLREILANEKKQMEEVNKTYEEKAKEGADKGKLEFDESKYKEKKRTREEEETRFEQEEREREARLLEEISSM